MTPVAYRHQTRDRELSSQLAGVAMMIALPALMLWTIFGFGSYGYTIRPTAVAALTTSDRTPAFSTATTGRLIDVTPARVTLVESGQTTRTIALHAGNLYGHQITLTSLTSVLHDATWLAATGRGHFTLHASLRLHGGLGLVAQSPAVRSLALNGPGASFVAVSGRSTTSLSGLRITGAPSALPHVVSPRPYLVFSEHATAYLTQMTLTNLGYDAADAYGLSFVDGATGSLDSVTATGNDIGLYLARTTNLSVTNSTFSHSLRYGVALRDGAAGNTFVQNHMVHNASAGLLVSGSSNNTLTQNTLNHNGQTGVVLTNRAASNTVTQNSIESNKGDGLLLAGNTNRNVIGGNIVLHNQIGVVADNAPAQSLIQANVIEENALSLHGLSLPSGSNYVAKTGSAYRMLPPKKWSFLFPGALLLGVLPLVWSSYYLRKRDLRSFWQEIEGDDESSKRPPRSMRTLYARWRATRHLFVQMRDTSYPIGPILSLPMPTTPSYPIEEIDVELSVRDAVTPRA